MFDKNKILEGYYSSLYFHKSKAIALRLAPNKIVTVQYFQRRDDVKLCGINEICKFLKEVFKNNKNNVKVWALSDGDIINKGEPVLQIEGPYNEICMFEGIIDGYLARQTSIATNCYQIVKVANGKKIIYMGDRADDYRLLEDDGYAASIGGLNIQTVPAQVARHNGEVVGTIPHALIQLFDGDLIKAVEAYHQTFPNESITGLVDFNNDVITDTLVLANRFQEKLVSVRVDTSESISDKYFDNFKIKEYGVNSKLIFALRKALDDQGYNHVKIIVSSGFNAEKIANFEKEKTPVDVYGVGASLLKIDNHFTCDSVRIDGKPLAKVGRSYRENSKLIRII